jgi:hypothetical protein
MAWLKRIELATGQCERRALVAGEEVVIERRRRQKNPLSLRQVKGSVRVFAEESATGPLWFSSPGEFGVPLTAGGHPSLHPPPASVQPLAHGATLNGGDCGYVFLEYAEHREPELEAQAVASAAGLERWVDWLERQADPFASPLRAMLGGHEFATRERWWFEGLNRGMTSLGAAFEMSGGFLPRLELRGGTLPVDLTVLHALSLRAARGVEDLTIELSRFLPAASWIPFACSGFFETAPWPASLRVLRLSQDGVGSVEARRCVEEIRKALPGLRVEA